MCAAAIVAAFLDKSVRVILVNRAFPAIQYVPRYPAFGMLGFQLYHKGVVSVGGAAGICSPVFHPFLHGFLPEYNFCALFFGIFVKAARISYDILRLRHYACVYPVLPHVFAAISRRQRLQRNQPACVMIIIVRPCFQLAGRNLFSDGSLAAPSQYCDVLDRQFRYHVFHLHECAQ